MPPTPLAQVFEGSLGRYGSGLANGTASQALLVQVRCFTPGLPLFYPWFTPVLHLVDPCFPLFLPLFYPYFTPVLPTPRLASPHVPSLPINARCLAPHRQEAVSGHEVITSGIRPPVSATHSAPLSDPHSPPYPTPHSPQPSFRPLIQPLIRTNLLFAPLSDPSFAPLSDPSFAPQVVVDTVTCLSQPPI